VKQRQPTQEKIGRQDALAAGPEEILYDFSPAGQISVTYDMPNGIRHITNH